MVLEIVEALHLLGIKNRRATPSSALRLAAWLDSVIRGAAAQSMALSPAMWHDADRWTTIVSMVANLLAVDS
jgi:hypothetical protein